MSSMLVLFISGEKGEVGGEDTALRIISSILTPPTAGEATPLVLTPFHVGSCPSSMFSSLSEMKSSMFVNSTSSFDWSSSRSIGTEWDSDSSNPAPKVGGANLTTMTETSVCAPHATAMSRSLLAAEDGVFISHTTLTALSWDTCLHRLSVPMMM